MSSCLYLINAHGSSQQLRRLVAALLRASEKSSILIHFDASAGAFDHSEFNQNPRVFFYPKPIPIRWGDFSLLESFIRTTHWGMERIDFDWLIWVSGQDYPLGTLDEFEEKLALSQFDGFFRSFEAIGHSGWPRDEGFKRYYFQYFGIPPNPYYYRVPAIIRETVEKARITFNNSQNLVRLIPRHRNNPSKIGLRNLRTPFTVNKPCFGGWVWLNIRRACVKYILDFVGDNPQYVDYFSRTYCPDEAFLHSILTNSGQFNFSNNPLRYVYWGDQLHPSSPKIITSGASLEVALDSGQPFARKFDESFDQRPLATLDSRISERIPAPSRFVE